MRPCEVYIRDPLFETLLGTGKDRRKLLEFIRRLKQYPTTGGDYREKGETLRDVEVKVLGESAIKFWFDAPVNIVMVVDIYPADD